MIPTLTTERLVLRAPAASDLAAYTAAWADPRTTRYIMGGPRSPGVSHAKFLQMAGMWLVFGYGFWLWADRASGAFIGCGGLANFARGIAELDGVPEAGWMLAPDAQGRGFAREAMQAALTWSDAALAAPEVRCIIDPDNIASIRMAEAVGFAPTGRVAHDDIVSLLMRRPRPS